MKAAMMELGQRNITTNALIPGLVDTPLATNYKPGRAWLRLAVPSRGLLVGTSLGRLGTDISIEDWLAASR